MTQRSRHGGRAALQKASDLLHRPIDVRGVLERLQRAVERDLLALGVDFAGKRLDSGGLARLARRVDDEILPLGDKAANVRHSVECRKHVVLGGEARPRDVEIFIHVKILPHRPTPCKTWNSDGRGIFYWK